MNSLRKLQSRKNKIIIIIIIIIIISVDKVFGILTHLEFYNMIIFFHRKNGFTCVSRVSETQKHEELR